MSGHLPEGGQARGGQDRGLARAGVDPRYSTEERRSFATANEEYLRWRRRFPELVAGATRSNQRYKWDRAMANHVLPAIGEAAEWTIPGDAATKIREDHVAPLSASALGLLDRARGLGDGKGVVFPAVGRRRADGRGGAPGHAPGRD